MSQFTEMSKRTRRNEQTSYCTQSLQTQVELSKEEMPQPLFVLWLDNIDRTAGEKVCKAFTNLGIKQVTVDRRNMRFITKNEKAIFPDTASTASYGKVVFLK